MADSSGVSAPPALSETREESDPKTEAQVALDVTNDETEETEKSSDENNSVATSDDGLSHFGLDIPSDAQLKQHRLGLDINEPWGWDGSSYNDYDIITVHGIRDDYQTAWTDTKGNWWVKEQLFENLSAREVDYSYLVHVEAAIFDTNGISLHAQELIEEYAAMRRSLEDTETDRPVIWVCHDIGGIIVKEALRIAMQDPAAYGKISILTTGIIFLGTPHRSESIEDLEEQLYKLLSLPGLEIAHERMRKSKALARQVNEINQRFLETKMLDRAGVFNLFTQNIRQSMEKCRFDGEILGGLVPIPLEHDEQDLISGPVTPFPFSAHHIGYAFEAAGRSRINTLDHLALARGEPDGTRFRWVSSLFNTDGFHVKVNYHIIQLQAWVLSLAPPTRALDVSWDPVLPVPPILEWIYKQEPFISFSKPGGGARLLHLHANGNRLMDISDYSRLFYFSYDSSSTLPARGEREPEKTTIYFEFDKQDSRYNSISSLLVYLLNMLVWRFWPHFEELISVELGFLSRMNSWSLDDLFHVYSMLRKSRRTTTALTIFISRFDHCPQDQREWFLERVLEEQRYSDKSYRVIVSTPDEKDLGVAAFPDKARINLEDSPVLHGYNEAVENLFKMMPDGLMAKRPVYETFRSSIEGLVEQLGDPDYLGQIVISWLLKNLRGKPNSVIADTISQFQLLTAHNVVKTFIASLDAKLQKRAETFFNWVKHAAEPWSPESITEALAVYETGSEEPTFEDLDVESTMKELVDVFGGIVVAKNGNVKFIHDTFYEVPTVGFEGSEEEAAAMVNGTMAKTCLRYFQLSHAQRTLAKLANNNSNAEGSPWATELDTAIIYRDRTNMASYAVRFWPHHYKLSGQFRPRESVHELFASAATRASWAIPYWLLSNPFTRMQRSYVSSLPTFAMLGLEDLVQQTVQKAEYWQDSGKECWYAITEAARAGHKVIVQQLLEKTMVDEDELQVALHWAAARKDQEIINLLLNKIQKPEIFQWPEDIIYQAAAAGLDDLLAFMLSAGHNVDEVCDFYWGAPLAVIIAWRNRVSTMEFLLGSEHKPDLTLKDENFGDDPLKTAADKGTPRMVELLLQNGADVETTNKNGKRPIQRAAQECNFRVIELLIEAKADFKSGRKDPRCFGPPLVIASIFGSKECVRVLLAAGADPSAEGPDGLTALYEAVARSDADIAQVLLEHDPKPDVEKAPPEQVAPLMRAIGLRNTELVSLLLEHGATVDFADKNAVDFTKTPLSLACAQGDLGMVKLLLAKGADVNYAEGGSDTPLLAATTGSFAVTKHLLLDESIDVNWAASDGTTALHMASFEPRLVAEFLKRGAHIDAHSQVYGTTLHKATRGNRIQTIKILLANDPKPDIDLVYGEDGREEDEIGFTALQLACKHSLPECVKVLLKGGANPRFKNKNGEDAIDIITRTQANSRGASECLHVLLSAPYSVPVDEVSEQGASRLHGIREKTPVWIVQQLVDANTPFDNQNREGHSPLSVAVSRGNTEVIRYLVEQGANVNRFGPSFGSILHIAVSKGELSIVKLLVSSGAELDTVDAEYGESLLYTALGIDDMAKLKAMVRYLVDEAKVPINKPGGAQFSYPIIRAANLARFSNDSSASVLKFLVERNANLNVADSQGRRAVHVASASWWEGGVKTLAKAGAEVDVRDASGRKPIHFAASALWFDCFKYLSDKYPDADINEPDHDGWTPLMWAARSGSLLTIGSLFRRDADVWVRSCDSNMKDQWSALKLLNFSGHSDPEESLKLGFQARTRPRLENGIEEWDDAFHKIAKGDVKAVECNSCFVNICGIEWKCITCDDHFSLCFKCFGRQSSVHNAEHEFEGIEPMYERHTPSPGFWEDGKSSNADKALEVDQDASAIQHEEAVDDGDDDAAWLRDESPSEFDVDPSDLGSRPGIVS